VRHNAPAILNLEERGRALTPPASSAAAGLDLGEGDLGRVTSSRTRMLRLVSRVPEVHDMTKTRTIGKLAKEVGVGVETVRFYEREGLIQQPRKGEGPRHYDDKALNTLRYIRIAQQLGLSLKELRALQGELTKGRSFCASLRSTVEAKLLALAEQAAEIARLQTELRAFLTRCRSRDPRLACPIVEELTRLDDAVSPKPSNQEQSR
jgi:MerR family mercuric resistance operon transcriptional regulator